jgi:hypothetical protein
LRCSCERLPFPGAVCNQARGHPYKISMDRFDVFWLAYPLAGWLFIFSPAFRRRTEERWANESRMQVMADVVGGVAGVVFSVLIPVFIWWQFAGGG